MGKLHVVGVRHHSPACARFTAHVIARVRPAFVLVEGPVDMNARMGELLLDHALPIAIYSYGHGEDRHHASWSPFCAYSPEWVAIRAAKDVGAEPLFVDLPAWHSAFSEVENRYSDRHSRASERMMRLCERLGMEDTDSLWDHLFEQPLTEDALGERLSTYFRELREGDDPGDRDREREAYMSRWVAWAMGQDRGDVVVVCGGYHQPELERAFAASGASSGASRPDVPEPEGASRTGSYLVPYSFHRLDSFVGYEAGMPSPEYYQRVWEDGASAGETMLFRAITHLRNKKQRVSPADAIAAMTLAQGIKLLRGHAELGRVDVLDGLAAAVVKDALDAPLPWNRRGVLASGTDPMLVAMVAAFSGDRVGKLAPGTPAPPLVADARLALEEVGIVPTAKTERLIVTMTEPSGLAKSRVLHRLRVLGIPGFVRKRGPSFRRDDSDLTEEWTITDTLESTSGLIEAAAYGGTLESAAAARLEEALRAATGLGAIAKLLFEAALVQIDSLATRLVGELARAAGAEPSFGELGGALSELLGLWKYDVLLGAAGSPLVGQTIEAAFDRGLWLFEGLDGDVGKTEVDGAVALRDAILQGATRLALDMPRAAAVMERTLASPDAPPALRGAALGFLWALSGRLGRVVEEETTALAVRGAGRPETLGDFLVGLFALAREEVLHAPALLGVVDGLVGPMSRDDFLVAIPALRLAFSYFPPREKERIAKHVLALHGATGKDVRSLTRLDVHVGVTERGMQIDAESDRLTSRFGLDAEVP